MDYEGILQWLLEGDVSIQYQVHRDLLSTQHTDIQDSIATKGWGAKFLSKRNPNGHWGKGFYLPKWTSTHYTLLDLRNLCISPDNLLIKASIAAIMKTHKTQDGGIRLVTASKSDVCVNGMLLNYSSYFGADEVLLQSIIDMLLKAKMPDGGFNCRSNRSGAVHSSLHTTLSVIEGLTAYGQYGYAYRIDQVKKAIESAEEFILLHQLFISDRTGKMINKDFLRFSYPRRWRYDILSSLDYFQYSGTKWDSRMQPAIDYLLKKRNRDGTWHLRAKHPGQTHFDMEKAGKASRWNTLRALRVLRHFGLTGRPLLILVAGLPGSGKSYFAERLAETIHADYVNSDRLRKELFPKRTYSDLEKATVYDVLLKRMKLAIAEKKNLVIDATFHTKETRQLFTKNTKEQINFVEVCAEEAIIKKRLQKKRPYSEADFEVYQLIQQQWEPFEDDHLTLESKNDNINAMLQKAMEYLKYDKKSNR